MVKNEETEHTFKDTEGSKYYFKPSGAYQTVSLYLDDAELGEFDFKNSYLMLDFLEKAIRYIEEDD